jgi:hypothetical protein
MGKEDTTSKMNGTEQLWELGWAAWGSAGKPRRWLNLCEDNESEVKGNPFAQVPR